MTLPKIWTARQKSDPSQGKFNSNLRQHFDLLGTEATQESTQES